MANAQMLDYVRSESAKGMSSDSIQSSLLANGWAQVDINEAFSILGVGAGLTPPQALNTIPVAPVKYAGFWIRWVANFVDGLILFLCNIVISFVVTPALSVVGITEMGASVASSLISLFIMWTYYVLMTHYKSATLGKMLVGITVKSDDFQKLSLGKIILRETIGKFLSAITLFIGYVMAGFTQKKQALHDMFAHSVVVYEDPSKPRSKGLIIGIILASILPVVAILGILSAVVLASLNTARERGQDDKVIADLSAIRINAEIYYGENDESYSITQNCMSGMFGTQSMQEVISDLPDKKVTCYAEGTSYAVSAPLSAEVDQSYCVDSTGYAANGTAFSNGSVASCQGVPGLGATPSTQ